MATPLHQARPRALLLLFLTLPHTLMSVATILTDADTAPPRPPRAPPQLCIKSSAKQNPAWQSVIFLRGTLAATLGAEASSASSSLLVRLPFGRRAEGPSGPRHTHYLQGTAGTGTCPANSTQAPRPARECHLLEVVSGVSGRVKGQRVGQEHLPGAVSNYLRKVARLVRQRLPHLFREHPGHLGGGAPATVGSV